MQDLPRRCKAKRVFDGQSKAQTSFDRSTLANEWHEVINCQSLAFILAVGNALDKLHIDFPLEHLLHIGFSCDQLSRMNVFNGHEVVIRLVHCTQ